MGILGMVAHATDAGIEARVVPYGNALIHRSRNQAIATARANAEFVLMVDDDMLPEPDALERLLARDVPVVSALCTTRTPPVQLAAKVYDEKTDQFVPMGAIRPDKLITGPFGVGGAFLLIRKDVILALREYYLSAQDWLVENRRTLDRLHVRADLREKERARRETIRRANWARERYLRIFANPVQENELELGEDIALSRKLLELKIPVAIDSGVTVAHLGEHPYGPWDIQEESHADQLG